MRTVSLTLAVFLLAGAAAAQDKTSTSSDESVALPDKPTPVGISPGTSEGVDSTKAASSPSVPLLAASELGPNAGMPSANGGGSPAPPISVYERYSWQVATDYMFFRRYELPGLQTNYNGVLVTGNYYFKSWLAAEGEFMGEWGRQAGVSSHVAFGGGGPRFRWSMPGNAEMFGHVLAGSMHVNPRPPFGSQDSFAYVVGGGVDFKPRNSRIAYRVGADAVGTRFFGTYQFSPRIYVGFVFNFRGFGRAGE
jgi:hypothetical protein